MSTLKKTPSRTHTHTHTHTLAPSILSLLKAPAGGLFWNVPGFDLRTRFDVLYDFETCSLEAHFQSREQPKATRRENRRVWWLGDERTFFPKPGIAAQQVTCGSVCYHDKDTTVPACHLSRRFLQTASRGLCKTGA
jgi:hypothetical protein